MDEQAFVRRPREEPAADGHRAGRVVSHGVRHRWGASWSGS
ncbi:hypothetical protein [Nonomuraea composti]|nr:hypothetical protein [Nonomuraea sp. FMUSA5-5]